MLIETHPTLEKKNKEHWINVSDFFLENEKINLNLLYIGKDYHTLEHLSQKFRFSFIAEDFSEAQRFIGDICLYNGKLPDVVFIDISLNEKELVNFCTFLHEEGILLRTPVLYNQKQLDNHQINLLKKLHLVDDVINFTSSRIDYSTKIKFLKRVKKEHNKTFAVQKQLTPVTEVRKKILLGIKRSIDIVLAGGAFLLLSPLFLLIAIAIKLESKGPVFYTSKRAGKGFKIFAFYKFRSMIANADKKVDSLSHLNQYTTNGTGSVFFKINNDPRVTKLGKFLRNSSLDELPQLFNVLKGDMSLVGNRPLPIYEAINLTTNDFVERFSAPAGITGLWQVNKRGKAEMSTEERISLDIHYSRNCSPLYDLKIMAKTPLALLQKSDV